MGSSRVVISTPEPMQVFVDGMLEPPASAFGSLCSHQARRARHRIHSLSGKFTPETVVVPENADVRVAS